MKRQLILPSFAADSDPRAAARARRMAICVALRGRILGLAMPGLGSFRQAGFLTPAILLTTA